MKKIIAFGASSSTNSINKKLAIYAANQISNSKVIVLDLNDFEMGISPGQACVFYSKDEVGDKVLGGGWITKTINNYLST